MADKVLLLTELEKDKLIGKQYAPNSFFNPEKDINGQWFISIQSRDKFLEVIEDQELLFIYDLPYIDHEPIITPPPGFIPE